jgi:2-dehydropantoate 2-reductase
MSTQNITHRLAGAPGQHEEPLRFLIVGAGAVGGFVAARLAGAGHHVTVLARPRSAARLRAGGLRIASHDGTSVLRPAVVTADQLTSGHDAIVLAVKSGDLDGAMADIEPAVKPPAVIVPFLNGMAHVEALSGRFGSPVLGGVLRVATELEDDGTIRVLTPQFDVELGELDGSPSTRVDRLAAAFKDAGADVTVPGNIIDAMCAAGADLIAGRRTEVEAVLADLAARARAAGTSPAVIDLAVLALRVHNRQVGS